MALLRNPASGDDPVWEEEPPDLYEDVPPDEYEADEDDDRWERDLGGEG